MVTSLRGSMDTGTKEDESSTGRIWAAGFHHVTARSGWASVLKIMNRLIFEFFSGRCKPRIRGSACILTGLPAILTEVLHDCPLYAS